VRLSQCAASVRSNRNVQAVQSGAPVFLRNAERRVVKLVRRNWAGPKVPRCSGLKVRAASLFEGVGELQHTLLAEGGSIHL
jgi:hypothetical protein